MPDVVTLGETMVMFSPGGQGPLRYINEFHKRLAGSESNVAIGLCRLGHTAGWISRLGQDEFGQYILKELRGEGVDVSQVKIDEQAPTGIMFKEIRSGYETRVSYYRKGSAASQMNKEDLDQEYIGKAKILHITGITPALSPTCRDTVYRAIEIAKSYGILISFDPNIRLKLWSIDQARKILIEIIPKCDIVLPGLDEAELLLGTSGVEDSIDRLLQLGVKKIAVKVGAEGCWVADANEKCQISGFNPGQIIDPIGAGDAFAAGFLSGILENKSLLECAVMANAMGALAVTTSGDYEGLPTRKELNDFLNGRQEIAR